MDVLPSPTRLLPHVIDTHVHLWDLERAPYAWLDGSPAIRKTYGLAEFSAATAEADVQRLVFVECTGSFDDAASQREVAWVSGLAEKDARIQGIVAHASLEKGYKDRAHLTWLAQQPLVKGVRRLLQSEADPNFCLQPAFLDGVRSLAEYSFTFDVCIFHDQLPSVIRLVEACPDVRFVLDHLGKPPVREGQMEPWKTHLAELASYPNIVCKISGLLTEADPDAWTPTDVRPYLTHAFDVFGFNRVLYGSDWPVLRLAADYEAWLRLVQETVQNASKQDQQNLFSANAQKVYRV